MGIRFDRHKYVRLWFEIKSQSQNDSNDIGDWIFVSPKSMLSDTIETKRYEQIEYFPDNVENLISLNTGSETVRFEKGETKYDEKLPNGQPDYVLYFYATKEKVKFNFFLNHTKKYHDIYLFFQRMIKSNVLELFLYVMYKL